MSIGKRVRLLRKELGLNQTEFGERIGLKQTAIGLYENDQRGVADRTILLICEKYGVQEEWLRTGKGKMFVDLDSTILSQLSYEYGLDTFEKSMIESFLKMSSEERKVIKSYVQNLVDNLTSDKQTNIEFQKDNHTNPKPSSFSTFKPAWQMTKEEIEAEVENYRQELLLEKKSQVKFSALPNTKKA